MDYYLKTFATSLNEKYSLCYLGTENFKPFVPHPYLQTIELLSVSYVVPVKRIYLIVEALKFCSEKNIKIHWTHIGAGPEMELAVNLARQNFKGNSSVQYDFLGSFENEKIHEYYKSHQVDLFVNMSESEGLPVSMMEAMSYGVPVIAPDVGGISEIVDDDSGWLLSKDECQKEFLAVIEEWVSYSQEMKHKKAFSAYKKWNLTFNAQKNYSAFTKALTNLTGKGADNEI